MGYGGVAQYLNLQGIKKIQRQNGKLSEWSGHLVRQFFLIHSIAHENEECCRIIV